MQIYIGYDSRKNCQINLKQKSIKLTRNDMYHLFYTIWDKNMVFLMYFNHYY